MTKKLLVIWGALGLMALTHTVLDMDSAGKMIVMFVIVITASAALSAMSPRPELPQLPSKPKIPTSTVSGKSRGTIVVKDSRSKSAMTKMEKALTPYLDGEPLRFCFVTRKNNFVAFTPTRVVEMIRQPGGKMKSVRSVLYTKVKQTVLRVDKSDPWFKVRTSECGCTWGRWGIKPDPYTLAMLSHLSYRMSAKKG